MDFGAAGSSQVTVKVAPSDTCKFKTTKLLFEVLHAVEGGRTRANCFDCFERGIRPFDMKHRHALEGLCRSRRESTDGETSLWRLKVMLTGLLVSISMKCAGRPQTKGLRRARTSGTSGTRAVIDCGCGRLVANWSASRAEVQRSWASYQR